MTSYCNQAVRYVSLAMGCDVFTEDMLANDMHDAMSTNQDFESVSGEKASELACKGCLVIASRKAKDHGHVAIVYPCMPEFSNSWKKKVPVVAHVGKAPNGLKRASLSFSVDFGEPDYFFWKPSEAS